MATEFLPKEIINRFIASEELLPLYDEIPDEFKTGNSKWNKLFNDWFFSGLTKLELTPKDGIDRDKAIRHIKIAMQGWDSGHEHKEAGVAYLMSLWFEDAKWEVKNTNP